MIKALQKLKTEGTDLNVIKTICDKSITNIILKGEDKSFKVRNDAGVSIALIKRSA